MTWHKIVVFPVLIGFFFTMIATAQPGDRYMNIKARVLDLAFLTDDAAKPYFLKLILRFGDSDTQIVITVYPGGKAEVSQHEISGIEKGGLGKLISKMLADNPDIKEQEIAARLDIRTTRSAINYKLLEPAIEELKTIQISPMLASRVTVDEASEYEFWCDKWQESVHYTITGPFNGTPQDKLVQWMIKFRSTLSGLLKQ